MAIGVQTDCSTPALANYGSDHLKRTYLAPALAGDMVTSIAVSEPGGGSDVGSVATAATRRGDTGDLVISGTKMWITSGLQAELQTKVKRKFSNISQSRRRPLVGPYPG